VTAANIAQIIAGVAVAFGVAALLLVILLTRRVSRLQADQQVVLGSRSTTKDIVSFARHLDGRLDDLRDELHTLSLEARDHEVRIDGCLSRVGVVRFDAYHDLGGRQSTVIGLLNANDNGVVITTVVSRDFARTYVKTIREGEPDIALAPEEEEALAQARARGNTPFTVRPRPTPSDRTAMEEAAATPVDTSTGTPRDLARENRRRRRQGLAPLGEDGREEVLGWPKLEPLEPLDERAFSPLEPETMEAGSPRESRAVKAGRADDDNPFADL